MTRLMGVPNYRFPELSVDGCPELSINYRFGLLRGDPVGCPELSLRGVRMPIRQLSTPDCAGAGECVRG